MSISQTTYFHKKSFILLNFFSVFLQMENIFFGKIILTKLFFTTRSQVLNTGEKKNLDQKKDHQKKTKCLTCTSGIPYTCVQSWQGVLLWTKTCNSVMFSLNTFSYNNPEINNSVTNLSHNILGWNNREMETKRKPNRRNCLLCIRQFSAVEKWIVTIINVSLMGVVFHTDACKVIGSNCPT